MTWSLSTVDVKDAAAATKHIVQATDGTNFGPAVTVLDNTGAITNPASQTTLASVLTAVQGATPAGTNLIGKVGIDQTTPGTTNLVQVGGSLPAGSNTIGGISNTTFVAIQSTAASLNATVVGAGTAGTPAGGVVSVQGASGGQALPVSGTVVVSAAPVPSVFTGNTTTRPNNTTAYTSGQILSTSTTAGSCTAATVQAAKATNQAFTVVGGGLTKSGTSISGQPIFRIHLYSAAVTFTNGDAGSFAGGLTAANWVGSLDVTMTTQGSDKAIGRASLTMGNSINYTPVPGQNYLYYVIEVRGAYTPVANEVFTPWLEVL